MRVPSRQQIRSGLKVFGFGLLPFWVLFGQNMANKHKEVRQRKRALDISTGFINNYQNGVGEKRLTPKEHRILRDMEVLLKKRHAELYSKVKGGRNEHAQYWLSKLLLQQHRDFLRKLQEHRENSRRSGEGT